MAELSKKTVAAWRDFFLDPAAKEGLTFLTQNHAPKVKRGDSAEDKLHTALEFAGYTTALDDIEIILTQFAPVAPESASIPELNR